MRLVLGSAKELLASHAPADILEDRINRAVERILISGKFMGGMDRIALTAPYGDLTLPRQYRTIEGVKIDRDSDGTYTVRTLANGWFEWLAGAQSAADITRDGFGMDNVRSLGDGNATMHDIPTEGTLSCTPTGLGDAYVVTMYGRDSDGMPITAELTRAAPSIANPFSRIERIHKEELAFPVKIIHTDDDANVTVVAQMEPKEEETYYRRYRDDSLTSVEEASVIALVKIRHIETTSDEDVLPIANITALGMEMDSLQFLAENDHTVSDQYHNKAIFLLNEELKDSHSPDELPMLRFHYPGGAPKLTSHM